MKKRQFDKPQPGNPHQLTIKEHCFPRASIQRFADSTGRVAVHRLRQGDVILVPTDNEIFCALRSWDHHTESRFMARIERQYQIVAARVAANPNESLSQLEMDTISAMFVLWNLREDFRSRSSLPASINGVTGLSRPVTQDAHENLEKHGVLSLRPDFSISGPQMTGMRIKLCFDELTEAMNGSSWRVVTSDRSDFVVPDRSFSNGILPVSPGLCFVHETVRLTSADVLNQLMREGTSNYYFSRPRGR